MKLTDISGRLGLSVSTVSRALRNAEGVDTQTRSRVLAEAARAGYRGAARQRLARGVKTRTVLALSRNDSGSMSYDAMAGMSQAAIELNVSILTHQAPHEFPESILNPKLQPPAMRAGQLDGIVLLNEWPEAVVAELQQIHPVVSMLYDYERCDVVGVDELEGMRSLAGHLEMAGSGPVGYFGICQGSTIYSRLHGAFKSLRSARSEPPSPTASSGMGILPMRNGAGTGRTPGPRDPAEPALAGESPLVEVPPNRDPADGAAAQDELAHHIRSGVRSWICPDVPCAELLRECAAPLGSGVTGRLLIGVFHSAGRQAAHALQWTFLEVPGEELGIAAVRRLLHRMDHPAESVRRVLLKAALVSGEPAPRPNLPRSHPQ